MNAKGLFGFGVKVKIVSREAMERVSGDANTVGYYDPDSMAIYLRNDLSAYWRWFYFFHECTHHVLYVSGADQTMTGPQVENVCQSVATMCMQLFPKIPARDKAKMRHP